jgi:hypothetical protein
VATGASRGLLILVLISALPALSEHAAGAAEEAAASTEDDGGVFELGGELLTRYRFRKSGDETDQDIYGYFTFDGESPARGAPAWRASPLFRFTVQGTYQVDIDSFRAPGDAASGDFFPFLDISNTFGDRAYGLLHAAYIESSQLIPFEAIRLGRQTIYRDTSILFDGAFVRTRACHGISLNAYGGVPAHLYESSARGDALGGGGIELEPVRNLRLGGDYLYVRDDRKDFADAEDNLWRIFGQYRFLRAWALRGSASWNGRRDRRQTVELRYQSEKLGLFAAFRALRQNGIVEFETSEFSPFVIVQGSYAPFLQYQLDLTKELHEKLSLGGGFMLRELENAADEGLYNREFRNGYLALNGVDLWAGMKASVRGDLWASTADDIGSVGFELEQGIGEALRLRAGTSYALYRIDLLTGEERNRDRLYYAEARWRAGENVDLEVEYRYERDSATEYHTAIGSIRLCF